MGTGRYQTVVTTTLLSANIPAAPTEAVILTTPAFELPVDSQSVLLLGYLGFVVGAAVTAVTLNFRRGTLISSTQISVGSLALNVTAGNNVSLPFMFVDTPGIVAGVQYSLTAAATGGAAPSPVGTMSCLLALAL